MKCCICGKECENEFGNNPWPISNNEEDRCCNECNDTWVLYARLNGNDKELIEKILKKAKENKNEI